MEKKKDEMETKKDKNSKQERVEENEETLISTHIFILPFKIINPDKNNREDLLLKQKEKWVVSEINEATKKYFNKYAKEALLPNYGDEKNNGKVIEKDYKNIQNGIYEINYKDKQYLLEVENVKIKCFDTNIGILSFILNNKSYEELEDILSINNFGRKLYRAYETEECPTINLYNSDKELEITQNISEANIIEITKERNIEKLENKIISYFLKTENIEIIQDDRMFVISHYLSQNWENINPIVSLKNDIEIKD